MDPRLKRWPIRAVAALGASALVLLAWWRLGGSRSEAGLASGNGRIEAVEIDIGARASGRLKELKVAEGDFVTAGQVVALLDTEVLEAQRRQAEAQLQQARSAVLLARSQSAQRESDLTAAQAVVAQREVDLDTARAQLARITALDTIVSRKEADDDRARVDGARAALASAKAQAGAAKAAIASARAQIAGAESNEAAAQANVEKLQADIDDAVLKSPRDGRVQVLVAHPGEIVAAGGRVLTLLDLSDVYMTFFLPTAEAGRVALGAEARIVLDAAPQYVLPARISFIASEAQFTPKTVETAKEREKLMFRLRAQLPPELLRKHLTQVKTGLPGVAYVRVDGGSGWPARLQVKLPR